MLVHIVNYGLSNLLSVQRATQKLGHTPVFATTPEEMENAKIILLPGVGAFRDGMAGLSRLGLGAALQGHAANGTPLLGICLGMQMLLEESDEFGLHKGLGLIPGRVEKIPATSTNGQKLLVPQIGWNALLPPEGNESFTSPLLANTPKGSEVYFVHSYAAKPTNPAHCIAATQYGGHSICAAVGSGNVFGTQFHPEKSGETGLAILQSFFQHAMQAL